MRIENEKKKLEGTYNSHEARNNGCVQMDASKNIERDRSTNTREQRAKNANVGTGRGGKVKINFSVLWDA